MASGSEEIGGLRIRVFKWNELLHGKDPLPTTGLFYFRISNRFPTSSTPGEEEGTNGVERFTESITRKVFHFELEWLLSPHSIIALGRAAVQISQQFLPETARRLGGEISNYLLSGFRFSPNTLLRSNAPRMAIVVEIHRTAAAAAAASMLSLFPTASPRYVFISDEEDGPGHIEGTDHRDYGADGTVEAENDPEECYSSDFQDIVCTLRKFLRVRRIVPMKPIAADEPLGLVQVMAEGALENLQVNQLHAGGLEGTCPICLDVFSTGAELTKTLCSHIFHRTCLFQWLSKMNSCPMCRSRFL